MPISTIIFDALALESNLNFTDAFQNIDFIWMEAPNLPPGLQLETSFALQLYVSPTQVRTYPLNDSALIDTDNALIIPKELKFSGINQRLVLLVEQDVDLRLHAVQSDCCSQSDLDSINNKLNAILAEKVANFLINAGLTLAGGTTVGQLLLAANAARSFFTVFNPSTEPILINFGQQATTTDYLFELAPGDMLRETDFVGEVFAVSKTGQPVDLKVGEF